MSLALRHIETSESGDTDTEIAQAKKYWCVGGTPSLWARKLLACMLALVGSILYISGQTKRCFLVDTNILFDIAH
jgi:hypothetical protein